MNNSVTLETKKNRKKKLMLNSISSFLLQGITIICGLILPRLIISTYGSEVNGLVIAITQFLTVIAFLELGIGSVIQSALYKPLAEKDNESISKIIASASKFFRRIARILVFYIIILIVIFPFIKESKFNAVYSGTLILSMGISSFAQYYFGVVDRLLLTADQKGYIQYIAQSATLIFNTIACVVLIRIGVGIQIIKLTTSIIYLVRPIFLRLYVNKHYGINRKIKYEGEPIKQKWNGLAQHIAAIVLDNTDTIVLTLFSNYSNVSIYGVYHLVVNGVKTLFTSMMSGVQSLFGELWAKQELDELKRVFSRAEWTVHTIVTFSYGCTASLIIPFVMIYTRDVNDADYNVPLFAFLITIANALHCLRLPYNMMILAGGHYKQTQSNYIIAALINIVTSIITVKIWGLIGVAIGTLVAMIYQTIWMAIYDSKNFINRPILEFIKHFIVNIVEFATAFWICSFFTMKSLSYFSWIFLAFKCALVWGITIIVFNIIFYNKQLVSFFTRLINRIKKANHAR